MGKIKKKVSTSTPPLPPSLPEAVTQSPTIKTHSKLLAGEMVRFVFPVHFWRVAAIVIHVYLFREGNSFVSSPSSLVSVKEHLSSPASAWQFLQHSPPGPCLFHTCLSPPWNNICLDVLSFIFSTRFTEDVNKQENVEGVNKQMNEVSGFRKAKPFTKVQLSPLCLHSDHVTKQALDICLPTSCHYKNLYFSFSLVFLFNSLPYLFVPTTCGDVPDVISQDR